MRVLRTTFLLTALTLVLITLGGYVGGRNGMTLALIVALIGNAFAYFFSDKIALLSSGARPVSRARAMTIRQRYADRSLRPAAPPPQRSRSSTPRISVVSSAARSRPPSGVRESSPTSSGGRRMPIGRNNGE